jgi:hypothetical protein
MVRLAITVRACAPPPPAIGVSTQVPPALVYIVANSLMAAASPPEVHQWITSAFWACAAPTAPTLISAAAASCFMRMFRIVMACLLGL